MGSIEQILKTFFYYEPPIYGRIIVVQALLLQHSFTVYYTMSLDVPLGPASLSLRPCAT
jgi:hypothetical protein